MHQDTLIQRIKGIKRELLSLKQVHLRGLGVANFFTRSERIEYTPSYVGEPLYIKVKFSDQDGNIPFAQCYLSNASYFIASESLWDENTNTLAFQYLFQISDTPIDLMAKVVASSPIEGITVIYGY